MMMFAGERCTDKHVRYAVMGAFSFLNKFKRILCAVLFRPARCNDLCAVHQGHRNVRSSDDVFHHSARGLLHRMDLWGWYHSDAVLSAHTVRPSFPCKIQSGFAVSVCFDSGEVSRMSLTLVYNY